jgi:hypothetical protein
MCLPELDLNGHGPLSPGAAIPTLFFPTVIAGFRAFGVKIACVHSGDSVLHFRNREKL